MEYKFTNGALDLGLDLLADRLVDCSCFVTQRCCIPAVHRCAKHVEGREGILPSCGARGLTPWLR
jgi:hypothetical protein